MAEYVELKKIMEFPIRRDHYDRENGDPHYINGIESVMEYIGTLPAVDAEPVIRCKNCKHWDCDDSEMYCDELGIFGTDMNSYCSYAKRK